MEKVKKGKLFTKLTLASKDIKGQRAIMIVEDIEAVQAALIQRLQTELRNLNREKLGLTDFGPDNEHDLRVTKKDFNPNSWVQNLQNVEIAILNKEIELDVAVKTYNTWFEEEVK